MRSLASMAVLVLSAGWAQAAPITYQFSGTIDSVMDPDRFGENIKAGDRFVARFIFDSAAPNLYTTNPYGGLYMPLSSTVTVGRVTFTGLPDTGQHPQGDYPQCLHLQAQSGPSSISLGAESASSPDVGRMSVAGRLVDWTGVALTSASLPLPGTAPGLGAFQQCDFYGSDPSTKSMEFTGTIASFQITPEPATLGLVSLTALAWRRRGRRGGL